MCLLLLTINFLHHVTVGMVLPALPRHIMDHGGNQLMIGAMYSGVYVFQQLHRDLFAMLPYGKWYCVKVTLCCSFFGLLVLVFHQTIFMTWVVRCFFALTANCAHHSKEYMQRTEPEEKRARRINMVEMTKAAGLAGGSICGGYLYVVEENYVANVTVASILALITLILVEFLRRDPPLEDASRFFSLPKIWYDHLLALPSVDLKSKRSFFVLKEVYIISIVMYLPRWVYIANFNYYIDCVRVGYAQAIEQLVLFASLCFAPFLKRQFNNQAQLLQHVMILCGFLLVGVFYAPTYFCHMLFFSVVLFMNTLAHSLLKDDAFGFKEDEEVEKASKTASTLTSIGVPIFTGLICHFSNGRVLKLVVLLPVGFYFMIISGNFLGE